jgi:predicted kinase
MIVITKKPKIQLEDLGIYIQLIQWEYNPENNKQIADLISEYFNVDCQEKDIEIYDALHVQNEDYEKLSREVDYGNMEHLIE